MWQGNEAGFWSTNSQRGTEALSLTACKELNSVNNYVRELGNRFPPVQSSYETAALTDMVGSLEGELEAEAPSLATSAFLIHKNWETINIVLNCYILRKFLTQ